MKCSQRAMRSVSPARLASSRSSCQYRSCSWAAGNAVKGIAAFNARNVPRCTSPFVPLPLWWAFQVAVHAPNPEGAPTWSVGVSCKAGRVHGHGHAQAACSRCCEADIGSQPWTLLFRMHRTMATDPACRALGVSSRVPGGSYWSLTRPEVRNACSWEKPQRFASAGRLRLD
jgi:hypothetical protein